MRTRIQFQCRFQRLSDFRFLALMVSFTQKVARELVQQFAEVVSFDIETAFGEFAYLGFVAGTSSCSDRMETSSMLGSGPSDTLVEVGVGVREQADALVGKDDGELLH